METEMHKDELPEPEFQRKHADAIPCRKSSAPSRRKKRRCLRPYSCRSVLFAGLRAICTRAAPSFSEQAPPEDPRSAQEPGSSRYDRYVSYWRHVPWPQPDEFAGFSSPEHTALRNPIREHPDFNRDWQSPMEYLKAAHSNPLVYPNYFCFPPGSQWSFFRCCLAKLATKDCWGRKLEFSSRVDEAAVGDHGDGGAYDSSATAEQPPENVGKNHVGLLQELITRIVEVEGAEQFVSAVKTYFQLDGAANEASLRDGASEDEAGGVLSAKGKVAGSKYVYERIVAHLKRRPLVGGFGNAEGRDFPSLPDAPDDVDVDDLLPYFNRTAEDAEHFLANGGVRRLKQRRFETITDNARLIRTLEQAAGLPALRRRDGTGAGDESDAAAAGLVPEFTNEQIFERLRLELVISPSLAHTHETARELIATSPDLCCHHTQAEETALVKFFEPMNILRAKTNLFECLAVLGDLHLRTLAVSFAQRGEFVGPYLNGPSLGFFQDVQRACDAHYNKEKRKLYAVSEQSFLLRPTQFFDLPARAKRRATPSEEIATPSEEIAEPDRGTFKKRFGIVSSCVEATLDYCSLTISFWQCYAMLHTQNTDLFYEAAYDYDLQLNQVTCARGLPTVQQAAELVDHDGAFLENASIRHSPLCRLVFDGLVSRWRAKPRACLHAFGTYEWNLAVDAADTSIGPGCFLTNLDQLVDGFFPPQAEVVVKDPSDAEDSNGGVFLFKSSKFGKLFVDLINDKDNWPTELIGGGCYPEQMAMNEALLELVSLELSTGGEPLYQSECLRYIFGMPGENGVFGCQFNTHIICFRHHLERMAGPYGERKTKKVFFLNPRRADVNFRPYGNVAMNASDLEEQIGSPFVWHWVNYVEKRPFILKHMLGGNSGWGGGGEAGKEVLEKYATPEGHFVPSQEWCGRVIDVSRQCTFGSPEEVCQHLPHQYISQC